jgi:hypothetical protein
LESPTKCIGRRFHQRRTCSHVPVIGQQIDSAQLPCLFVRIFIAAIAYVREPNNGALDLGDEDLVRSDLLTCEPFSPGLFPSFDGQRIEELIGNLAAALLRRLWS